MTILRNILIVCLACLPFSSQSYGDEHVLEGSAVHCAGRPGALIYQGKRIEFAQPETLRCVSRQDVTISQAAYDAIPYLATVPAQAKVIALDSNHAGLMLGTGVGGKTVVLVPGSETIVRVNGLRGPFIYVNGASYQRYVALMVAELPLRRPPPSVPIKGGGDR
jgi:hypothetical protein